MLSVPQTLQSAKGDRMTLCGLHSAVISVKMDLSLIERRLDKEKDEQCNSSCKVSHECLATL